MSLHDTIWALGQIKSNYINSAITNFANDANCENNRAICRFLWFLGFEDAKEFEIFRSIFLMEIEKKMLGKDKPSCCLDQVEKKGRAMQEAGGLPD